MRILFTSTKGTGHARPLLPYIHEFIKLGHEVRFAAPEQLRALIEDSGASLSPLSRRSEGEVQAYWAHAHDLSPQEQIKFSVQEFFVKMWAGDALPDLLKLVEDWTPDIMVRESAEMAAPVIAAKTKTPHFRIEVHNSPTENQFLTHSQQPLDTLRQSVGLGCDSGLSLLSESAFTLFPRSFDPTEVWSGRREPFRVNTQLHSNKPTSRRPAWAPDNGHPLVYLTFGTVAGNESTERDAYQTALEAVGTLPIKVLLTTGHNMNMALLTNVPKNVIIEPWVPQDEVFSFASVIVHHCGSGTLIGTLAAGLPSVAVPLFADQPDNAEQVERIGAGIPVFKLDAPSLQSAIMRVLEDNSFRANSARIAKEISDLPSIEDAVNEMCVLSQSKPAR